MTPAEMLRVAELTATKVLQHDLDSKKPGSQTPSILLRSTWKHVHAVEDAQARLARDVDRRLAAIEAALARLEASHGGPGDG